MRSDMFKVIVERPRRVGGGARPGRVTLDEEKLPTKLSMKRTHKGNTKDLNENLSPLKRFLESNVGRPWSKVYSEICEVLDMDSAVKKHVRDHVKDYVETSTYRDEEGKVRSRRGHEMYFKQFYVDPDSGLLEQSKAPSWKKRWRLLQAEEPQNPLGWLAKYLNEALGTKHFKMVAVSGEESLLCRDFYDEVQDSYVNRNVASVKHANQDWPKVMTLQGWERTKMRDLWKQNKAIWQRDPYICTLFETLIAVWSRKK